MSGLPLGGDSSYLLDLYSRYLRDPLRVPADLRLHFDLMDEGEGPRVRVADDSALRMIEAWRRHGHREAGLDPLGLAAPLPHPLLAALRASATDGRLCEYELAGQPARSSLRDLAGALDRIYTSTAAIEASHLLDPEMEEWLHARFEAAQLEPVAPELAERTLVAIALADMFESFLQIKFPTKKRFGIEGAEASAVLLAEVIRAARDADFGEIVIGGMHRGRLGMLATVLDKPLATLIAEVKGRDLTLGTADYTGDVPYHLGHVHEAVAHGRRTRMTIAPHPSHLLAVAPVVAGIAKARRGTGRGGDDVLCLLMHTDAAFSGQGVVSELFQLAQLEGYSVGGTIHLVTNNQIGFTTRPSEGRSAHYCTDVAKMTGAPVLHVNGDDPLAVAKAAQVALAWRRRFGRDIVIDLVCYRRNGHNELDEPRFTQPDMCREIDMRPPLRESFSASLAKDFPAAVAVADLAASAFREKLDAAFAQADTLAPRVPPPFIDGWQDVEAAGTEAILADVASGIDRILLAKIGTESAGVPPGVAADPKVDKFYATRREAIATGDQINMATAETLAFATLLHEGVSVRLSGQDCVRGTFTQRHLAVHDTASGEAFFPVAAAARAGARFEAVNSPLSEYAVLGFEYGHSLASPRQLVLWEAQFGDFLNGAQIIVDQFIVSAEAKWLLKSGLVILLPHGLEGQGPDHSSARIERLLQLCANGNMIVANPSTPANLFHLLRRQVKAPWRKPLFVISPKSLLRVRECRSTFAEMDKGTAFRPFIVDRETRSGCAERVIFCSGKLFYDIERTRAEAGACDRTAVVRLEQLYPFPEERLAAELAAYDSAADWVWCQEEPENQGAWPYVVEKFRALRPDRRLRYAGRGALPVAAGGSIDRHVEEQKAIIADAFSI